MCDPTLISAASAAASLAGSVMQTSSQNQQAADIVRARENALRNTITKQNALREEAAASYQPVLDSAGDDSAARAAAEAKRLDAYTSAASKTPPSVSAAPSALTGTGVPQVVTSELNRKLARSRSEADAASGRRAKLDAYGDVSKERAFDTGKLRGTLGMLSDFSQGEGALLPGTINAAETNIMNRGTSPFGPLLQGAGNLGFLYGVTRPVGWSLFGQNPYTAQPGAGLAWRYDK